MFANAARRVFLLLALVCGAASLAPGAETAKGRTPDNLFLDPSFENAEHDQWSAGTAGITDVKFTVDAAEAADGKQSALLRVGAVEGYGVQFGQRVGAPTVGKTYTFAVLAKSMKGPVTLGLEIERPASPWDRAARAQGLGVGSDGWKELHVTFKVDKPFDEGWFAYVSCAQPNVEFRLDMFRLYEGDYVPSKLATQQISAAVSAQPVATAEEPKPAQPVPDAATDASVKLFDTGNVSAAPLSGAAVAKQVGWKSVPEDMTDHAFSGDAVLVNNRLAVVFRRGGPGAEVYGRGQQPFALRAILTPVGEAAEMALGSVTIADNSAAESAIDATFQSKGGKTATVRFSLGAGQLYVKTEVRSGAKALAVRAPSRFIVMPDFFADDIVVDAAQIPIATAELPSENFLIHLLPDRNAIVMTVADSREQDAKVTLSGSDSQRLINRSDVYYGSGKVWVAVLEAPGIWHHRDVVKDETNKIIPLQWTAPFPAQWRSGFYRRR